MIQTKEYIVNGETYTVSIDQEEKFLKENPNAILQFPVAEVDVPEVEIETDLSPENQEKIKQEKDTLLKVNSFSTLLSNRVDSNNIEVDTNSYKLDLNPKIDFFNAKKKSNFKLNAFVNVNDVVNLDSIPKINMFNQLQDLSFSEEDIKLYKDFINKKSEIIRRNEKYREDLEGYSDDPLSDPYFNLDGIISFRDDMKIPNFDEFGVSFDFSPKEPYSLLDPIEHEQMVLNINDLIEANRDPAYEEVDNLYVNIENLKKPTYLENIEQYEQEKKRVELLPDTDGDGEVTPLEQTIWDNQQAKFDELQEEQNKLNTIAQKEYFNNKLEKVDELYNNTLNVYKSDIDMSIDEFFEGTINPTTGLLGDEFEGSNFKFEIKYDVEIGYGHIAPFTYIHVKDSDGNWVTYNGGGGLDHFDYKHEETDPEFTELMNLFNIYQKSKTIKENATGNWHEDLTPAQIVYVESTFEQGLEDNPYLVDYQVQKSLRKGNEINNVKLTDELLETIEAPTLDEYIEHSNEVQHLNQENFITDNVKLIEDIKLEFYSNEENQKIHSDLWKKYSPQINKEFYDEEQMINNVLSYKLQELQKKYAKMFLTLETKDGIYDPNDILKLEQEFQKEWEAIHMVEAASLYEKKDAYFQALIMNDPAKIALDEKYINYIHEKTDIPFNEYVDKWGAQYNQWTLEELEELGNTLDSMGWIDSSLGLSTEDRLNLLEVTLAQALYQKELTNPDCIADPIDKDEYIKEYYHYFYTKMMDASGSAFSTKESIDKMNQTFFGDVMTRDAQDYIKNGPNALYKDQFGNDAVRGVRYYRAVDYRDQSTKGPGAASAGFAGGLKVSFYEVDGLYEMFDEEGNMLSWEEYDKLVILNKASKDVYQSVKEIINSGIKNAWDPNQGTRIDLPAGFNPRDGNWGYLTTAVGQEWYLRKIPMLKQLDRATEDILERPITKRDMGASPFISGFLSGRTHEYIPFVSSLVNWKEKDRIYKIDKKIKEQGVESLTDSELMFMQINSVKQNTDALVREISPGYNIGANIKDAVPWVGEMVIGSPINAAVKTGFKTFLKKKLMSNVLKNGKIVGGNIVLNNGMKLSRGALYKSNVINGFSWFAGLTAQASASGSIRTAENMIDRMTAEYMWAFSTDADGIINDLTLLTPHLTDEEKSRTRVFTDDGLVSGEFINLSEGEAFEEAFFRAYGLTYAEYFTERLGAFLPGIPRGALNKISGFGGKGKLGDFVFDSDFWQRATLGHFMRKMGFTPGAEFVEWVGKNSGWHGIFSELGEEWINIPLSNLIDGNAPMLSGFMEYDADGNIVGIDWDSQYELAGTVFAMGGAFNGTSLVYNKVRGKSAPHYDISTNGKKSYIRFHTKKQADLYLDKLRKEGFFDKEYDLDIKIWNDYLTYDSWGKVYGIANVIDQETSGDYTNRSVSIEVNAPGKISIGDKQTADELEVMSVDEKDGGLNEEQRSELFAINDRLSELKNKKSLTAEEKQEKIDLQKAKKDLIGHIESKIIQRKTKRAYKEQVQKVKDLIAKAKLDDKIKITEALTDEETETEILKLFGLKKNKKGEYVDSNGNVVDKVGEEGKQQLISEILHELKTTHGYYVPASMLPEGEKSHIIINMSASFKNRGENVAAHEFFHWYLDQVLDHNPEVRIAVGESFKAYLMSIDPKGVRDKAFRDRLQSYRGSDPAVQSEEAMALFLDALANGSMQYKEGVFTKIGEMIRLLFQKMGIDIEFNEGKDVYNFIKDFNASMQRGELSTELMAALDNKIKVSGDMKNLAVKAKEILDKQSKEIEEANKLTIKEVYEKAGVDLTEKQLNYIYDKIKAGEGGVKTSKTGTSESAEFKNNTAAIIEENNRIYNEILKNAKKKGISEDNLKDAITARLRNDLIINNMAAANRYAKKAYDAGINATRGTSFQAAPLEDLQQEFMIELVSLANTWDPSVNPNFGAYIQMPKALPIRYGQVLDRVLGTKGISTVSLTALEETGFDIADTDGPRVTTSSKQMGGKIVMQELGLDDKAVVNVESVVRRANIPLKGLNYKGVKPLVKTGKLRPILNTVSEKFGIDPKRIIKNQDLNAAQRTSAREFILELSKKGNLIDLLPEGQGPDGTSTGVANTVFGKFYVKGGRAKMAEGATAAGKAIQAKNENVTNEEFLNIFGINQDGTVKPGRQYDGAMREFVVQLSQLAANQQIRLDAVEKGITPDIVTPIGVGKSQIMFSNSAIPGAERILSETDNILDEFDNGFTGLNMMLDINNLPNMPTIKTEEDIEPWIDSLKRSRVFRLGPKEIFFSPKKRWNTSLGKETYASIFTTSSKSLSGMSSKNPVWIKFQERIQDLHKENIKYGNKIPGVKNNEIWGLRGIYAKVFTETKNGKKVSSPDKARSSKKEIENFNNKIAKIHKTIWSRINSLIKDDTSNAVGIGLYLSLVANDTKHWHKLGAQIIGFSTKLNPYIHNGKARQPRFEFEHAMPATAAYLYLLNSALTPGVNFEVAYDFIIENYKLIALDKFMDLKLTHARTASGFSLQRRMPDNWSVIDGKLWQRYFNEIVEAINGGIDPASIETLDGKTLADMFNINASGGIKMSKSSTEIKNIQTIDSAFRNRIKNSKSGKSRGMSTFDFDDTLARTKSGVIYTIPNPEGTPAPGRKVIFLAGSAGSGKSNVIKQLGLEKQGYKIVNQDIALEWLVKNSGLPTDMRDFTPEQASKWGSLQWEAREIAQRKQMKFQGRGDGIVVDGTGASEISMGTQVMKFRNAGYDVHMLFVDSSLETALARNQARKERSLKDFIVERNWKAVQKNKKVFKEDFKENFAEINTDKLKQGDPMPKSLVNKMNKFTNSYIKGRLTAEEFANKGNEMLEKGAKFDFSEFNKVVGGKPGPLLDKAKARAKKYGTKDMFVLTARPQASAQPIQEFLHSQGLHIPLKNITGLANSTGEAKAMWMLEKFAEGYNDMYFVDDAFQNVKAVQDVLSQLDIKSKVVQAKIKFSKGASKKFNEMLERRKGVDAEKVFSSAEARKRGSQPDIIRFVKSLYIPPSAEDFKGLLYYFLNKGKQGEADMQFFADNLLKPFAEGIRAWNTYKQNMVTDYAALRKEFPKVAKKLNNIVPGTSFTNDTAIRVYLWAKAGFEIPGISRSLQRKLVRHVNNNPDIKAFADGLSVLTKRKKGYVEPDENWMVQGIPTDLRKVVDRIGRKEFLQEWIENKNIIFSPENLNKIEALYGNRFLEALKNILYRMENGGHRPQGKDSDVNWFTNWINGSVGAIMFFNMRSAILQTISTVNFINWSDNNIFKASAAFANQPQFWKDFAMLFNSDQLKQRRTGLQTDVSASELTKTFAEKGYSPQTVINYLLQIGFKPTQIADSFAIAFGGATFYRNRYNKYIKEGMSPKQAHDQSMLDFQEVAEETQQSSREDLISQQQASVLGRIVLAFQNVTMQYGRLTKKALSDLVNRRGDMKTNISKILYYGTVQNIVFSALQNALAFLIWGSEDEELIKDKTTRTLNSALDSFLRGTGLYGALVSTLKNTVIQWNNQKDKPWGQERIEKIGLEVINLSPPIGSKVRKIVNAYYADSWNEGVSEELGWRIENPKLTMSANILEAVFNIPLARIQNKANNLEEAITGNHETWKRIMLSLGWSRWDLGIKDEELEEAKEKAKEKNKEKKKEEKAKEKEELEKQEQIEKEKKGIKVVRCSGTNSSGQRCGMTTETAEKTWKCMHHMEFKDGMDRDGDGIKEYRCKAITTSGKRCKNKTENKSKKCYAHQ